MSSWELFFGILVIGGLTLFSTLNHALRLPSRARIAERFKKGGRADHFEQFVSVRPEYLLATSVLTTIATLILFLMIVLQADASLTQGGSQNSTDLYVAFATVFFLLLIFGVAIPNAWAKYAGETLVFRSLGLLALVRMVCYPIIIFLLLFDPLVRRLAGVPMRDAKSYADELEQEILDAVSEGERHGAVDEEEKEMIESVIELTDTHVEEIMTPRTDIVAIPKDCDLTTVLETIRSKGHSRIPVYDGTIDTILGVLYAKDLLQRDENKPFELTAAMRKVPFIPESKLVRQMLREFQAQKLHIAIVLDEYGGTAGLITMEDIIEELVGEIRDEYDPAEPAELKRIDDGNVEVDARMRIDDLNDQLDLNLPEDEDYETIGGMVFSRMGRIPKAGERCSAANVEIQVITAEPRRITRLKLHIKPTEKNEEV